MKKNLKNRITAIVFAVCVLTCIANVNHVFTFGSSIVYIAFMIAAVIRLLLSPQRIIANIFLTIITLLWLWLTFNFNLILAIITLICYASLFIQVRK